MIYIENEGALFRGVSRGIPKEVWNPQERRFEPYDGKVPKPIEWGEVISEQEAQEIMGEEEPEKRMAAE